MKITKIHIKNIRGFDDTTLSFQILANRANILVAPNGFGKSSISTAFSCATGRKLIVEKKDKHKQAEGLPSLFRIEVDGAWLEANYANNDITQKFDVHVVKSGLTPKAKMPKINGFSVAKPYLEIAPLDLGPCTQKADLNYDPSHLKLQLGKNAKCLPNITKVCADNFLRHKLLEATEDIEGLSKTKAKSFFTRLIAHISKLDGTKKSISDEAEAAFAAELSQLSAVHSVFSTIGAYVPGASWIERVLLCAQLSESFEASKLNTKKWMRYGQYQYEIETHKKFISSINGAWVSAEVKEVKGRLTIRFPEAESLSNGQRDLLYFGCRFLEARKSASKKPSIFIVDEVFDYLDDANIILAQYFLSKMIEHYKNEGREVYICLLTHLDPSFFKGYALRKQTTIYLSNSSQTISQTMRKVILNRDDPLWSNEISQYFLHFHPDDIDISAVFNANFGLPKAHGTSKGFLEFVKSEWEKCLADSASYDPFAVCAFIRLKIEEIAYTKIPSSDERSNFIATHGTANKLEHAESVGVKVPESCFLLGALYNEALHKKGSLETSSSIALKLKNLALRNMINSAVNW